MSEAYKRMRKRLWRGKEPYKLKRPEITLGDLLKARREGFRITKVRDKVYAIDKYRVLIKGDPAEIESALKKARREEQQIKRELVSAKEAYKRGLKETVNKVIKELQHLIKEEEEDYKKYDALANKYGFTMLPTYGGILRELAQEESKHATRLRSLISELERGLSKELAEV